MSRGRDKVKTDEVPRAREWQIGQLQPDEDDGREFHRLRGRRVSDGDRLELFLGERWQAGRYAWTDRHGDPVLRTDQGEALVLKPDSVLRWPEHE